MDLINQTISANEMVLAVKNQVSGMMCCIFESCAASDSGTGGAGPAERGAAAQDSKIHPHKKTTHLPKNRWANNLRQPGRGDGTRTRTGRILSPLPLPIGLLPQRLGVEAATRFELVIMDLQSIALGHLAMPPSKGGNLTLPVGLCPEFAIRFGVSLS
jgi:hypothetical protein